MPSNTFPSGLNDFPPHSPLAAFHLCFRKPWSFLTFPSYTLPSKAQTDVIRGQPDVPICRVCSCPGNCVLGCTGCLCLSLDCNVLPRQTVFSLRPPRATTVHLLFSLHSKPRVAALGKAGPCVTNALQVPGAKGLLTQAANKRKFIHLCRLTLKYSFRFSGKSQIPLRIPLQLCNSLSLEVIVCLLSAHTQPLPPGLG